jgi:RNA polymerase sigma-70 factor (ECF subfamily)
MTAGSATADSSSSRLLQGLRAKNPGAWERLASLYGPLVYYWCRRSGLQPSDAADVLQEVFAAVWGGIGSFAHRPGQGRFRGWLWTITRNKIRDHFRTLAARTDMVGGDPTQLTLATAPEEADAEPSDAENSRELKGLFHRALDVVRAQFEDRTWEAFDRVVVGGCTTAEVAAALGMSVNSVRQARSRVLRRLREELGDMLE